MPIDTAKRLRLVSPYNQELVAEVPWDSAADVEKKLDLARRAHIAWRALPLETRIAQVTAAMGYFRTESAKIAREISQQMGKPIVLEEFDKVDFCRTREGRERKPKAKGSKNTQVGA